MTKKQVVKNWIFKADKDLETAKVLFKLGRYEWCLYIWHLAIEKVIKARFIVTNKEMPYIHNLTRLAKHAGHVLKETEAQQLKEITTFNIEARYDDYKLSFYKKATRDYAKKWQSICNSLYNKLKDDIYERH